ncbi:DUF2254 domain-containing protein [Marivita hallyeonensis]|uniref:Uncharacterized membrane protein n=1 Tax=Marivita hallyeonensis TaxID=996342 RepID=A0A1M5MU45_9RHOB|nr:DUF2254 domain-containing protein [Marivita hallyeonensis]SHG80874.1 Uncharacterized membrane protein [Marivita hallyeonensis]
MRARIWLILSRLWRRPGIRISAFGAAALIIAMIAPLLDRFIPEGLSDRFSRDAVLPILNILASSMLAVTTFSLGIMVSAFRSAAGQATPRAYRILMQDMTTLNVMSVFVGAFLFSLGAIVMFRAGFYGDSAAVIVFAMTLVCIFLIIIAILRWIAHLSQLGSLDHTLALVEAAAAPPLRRLAKTPNLGARNANNAPRVPDDAATLCAPVSGYVQFISLAELNTQLGKEEATLWVTAPPGSWVLKGAAIGYVSGFEEPDALLENFTLGDKRTVEQDARFGMVILSEVASRALSPGVNDPGTAIDVIHRMERILWEVSQQMATNDRDIETKYENVIIGTVSADDLLQDGFAALMQDGGDRFDVMAQMLKAANRLSRSEWSDMAKGAEKLRDTALGIIDRRIEDPDAVESLRQKAKQT